MFLETKGFFFSEIHTCTTRYRVFLCCHDQNNKKKCFIPKLKHQDNMSVQCIPPYTLLLYSKAGVCSGMTIFLIFAPKHRLWVLAEAVLMCTHNLCFEQKQEKYRKIFMFYNFRNHCILHGHVVA